VIRFDLRGAAAWSPGIETPEQWAKWAREPRPLEREGRPDLGFLPALMRRRCDQLSRMMLWVAHACCPSELLAEVNTVFASRHGAFGAMVRMLHDLAAEKPLSPALFSHSVHNTQAGIFSIWAHNERVSSSVAAGAETFGSGFLEALGLLQAEPARPVLYVCGDEAIPDAVRGICDHDQGAFALALLLGAGNAEARFELALEASRAATPLAHPDALEFLRWLQSDADELRLAHSRTAFRFRRRAGRPSAGTRGSC